MRVSWVMLLVVFFLVLPWFKRRKGRRRLVWTERQRLREAVVVLSSHLRLSSFGRGRREGIGEGGELRGEKEGAAL